SSSGTPSPKHSTVAKTTTSTVSPKSSVSITRVATTATSSPTSSKPLVLSPPSSRALVPYPRSSPASRAGGQFGHHHQQPPLSPQLSRMAPFYPPIPTGDPIGIPRPPSNPFLPYHQNAASAAALEAFS